jgi:hypothetical protein
MTIKSVFKTLLASLLLVVPTIQAAMLDFEGFANGQIMDVEYQPLVTISAFNNDSGQSGVPNYAVIFDTGTPTHDPDLASPFYSSQSDLDNKINPYDPGNVLIIQENDVGCGDGVCDNPDDEGSRPAGYISFDFHQTIELLSIDFFDIESPENGTSPNNRIDIWDGNDVFVGTIGHTPNTGGDRLWQQLLLDSTVHPELLNVGRVDVYFGGSGALDNLTYNVVPVPAAIWLFGTALIGLVGFGKRRKAA